MLDGAARCTKDRILAEIARRGRVTDPKELVLAAGTDVHHVVHLVWRLQKQGLITFRQEREGGRTVPRRIRLTHHNWRNR